MQDYLKWIRVAGIGMLTGMALGGYWAGHKYCLKLIESRALEDKHLNMVRLYDAWMMTKQRGASVSEYLTNHDIHTVAIYGMSYMGIRLFHDLKDSSVQVKYGIDRELKMRIPGIMTYHPDEVQEKEVDAVIVTAIFSFDFIKKDLRALGFKRIVALDEILYDLM